MHKMVNITFTKKAVDHVDPIVHSQAKNERQDNDIRHIDGLIKNDAQSERE